MSDLAPITGAPAGRIDPLNDPVGRTDALHPARPSQRGKDEVELSDVARMLSRLRSLPETRPDLIESVRTQIDAGTYDTPERFDAAIDRLLDEEVDLFA